MTDQPTCPFKPGDLVRHRASGEPAIVVEACTECAVHTDVQHFAASFVGGNVRERIGPCRHAYNGKVRVTTRFGRTDVCVNDWMLEAVPESEPGRPTAPTTRPAQTESMVDSLPRFNVGDFVRIDTICDKGSAAKVVSVRGGMFFIRLVGTGEEWSLPLENLKAWTPRQGEGVKITGPSSSNLSGCKGFYATVSDITSSGAIDLGPRFAPGYRLYDRSSLEPVEHDGKTPQPGDYVLATKYDDGDPCDHFYVGFVSGFTHHGRYLIVDNKGNNQRGNGFRRAEKITGEEGAKLIALMPEIGDKPGRSLWWHLGKIRGEESPEDPCEPGDEEN